MVWTVTRQKEITIPLKTKNKSIAFKRGKKASDEAHNIKDGAIQRFPFKDYFAWLNDDGTSKLMDLLFKRCFIFYELTGMRAIEPMIAELYENWLYIDASKSKGDIPTESPFIRRAEGNLDGNKGIQRWICFS